MIYPKISIITPSFNQGAFIEETILSVLGQGYPNLEYIIIDGGSTDETIEIIKKYEKDIFYWVSEKDKGQSHAINKGFEKATGDILAWINSDDLYLPGTFSYIASQINCDNPTIYFGNCIHFKETDKELIASGSNVVEGHININLSYADYIIQPSTFWTRFTWNTLGELREDLHFGFDWEWFLRARKLNIPFVSTPKCLSMYRFHDAHKSAIGGHIRQQELLKIFFEYSNEAAVLYQHLISETFSLSSIKGRLLIVISKILNLPTSYVYILRLSNKKKYRNYSAKQIAEVRSML